MTLKIGIAGLGAIGRAVAKFITTQEHAAHENETSPQHDNKVNPDNGLPLDIMLHRVSDPFSEDDYGVPNVDFLTLAQDCDLVIECLPAKIAPQLAEAVFAADKDIIFISAAAFLLYPQLVDKLKSSQSNAYIPSGALCGIDGVRAMREMGITSSMIASTKPPRGLAGAPYIIENNIDLDTITTKTRIFKGNAFDAARGFPANVNVAATLSIAGIGADDTHVEVWADPNATGNAHEVTVKTAYSTLNARIENQPDPANPKSSVLAAQSINATLRNMASAFKLSP